MTQKDENYLLQEICRNSGMGVAAINQVLKDVYDEEFAYELNVQADKMEQFARKAGIRLRENGSEPSEPKPIATAMLVTAIRMKQALQNRTEDVADLIGKGNERGRGDRAVDAPQLRRGGTLVVDAGDPPDHARQRDEHDEQGHNGEEARR